jgi:hypothetical protein
MSVFLHRTDTDEPWSVTVSDPNHFQLWDMEPVARAENSALFPNIKKWCDGLVYKLTAQRECREIKIISGAAPNRFYDSHCFTSVCLDMILLCHCSEKDASNGTEAIKYTGKAGKLALAFNVHYLLDGLKAFRSSESVTLSANGATTPVVLTPTNAPDQTYLIMPVQIRS